MFCVLHDAADQYTIHAGQSWYSCHGHSVGDNRSVIKMRTNTLSINPVWLFSTVRRNRNTSNKTIYVHQPRMVILIKNLQKIQKKKQLVVTYGV
jgi:hypothetical protein